MYAGLKLSLPDERQRHILEQLGRDGRVLAIDLARRFDVSEDTVRRDLRELSAAGFCRRVYGGALPVSPANGELAQREEAHPARKEALGRAVAGLVAATLQPGDVLFLDTGSTNLAVARALPPGLGITVATNAPHIAASLTAVPDIELILIGGRVDAGCAAALGARALRDLQAIRVDLAILGVCALDPDAGLAAFHFEDAEFKRCLAETARVVATAVTSDKLGTSAPYAIIPASSLTHLFVEAEAPSAAVRPLEVLGVQIHRAVPPEPR